MKSFNKHFKNCCYFAIVEIHLQPMIYIHRYQWFMRADDDAYVKTDQLEKFLRNLNSSQPIFLGQTGLGNAEVTAHFLNVSC